MYTYISTPSLEPMMNNRTFPLLLVSVGLALITGCAAQNEEGAGETSSDALTESATIRGVMTGNPTVPTDLAIGRSVDEIIGEKTEGDARLLRQYRKEKDGLSFLCDETAFGDTQKNIKRGFHPIRIVCRAGDVKTDMFALYPNLGASGLPSSSFTDANGDGRIDAFVDDGIQGHDDNFDGKVDGLIDFAPTLATLESSASGDAWTLRPGAEITSHARWDKDFDGRFDTETFTAEPGFLPRAR